MFLEKKDNTDDPIAGALADVKQHFDDTLKELKQAQTDLTEKLATHEAKTASNEDVTDIKSRMEDSRKELGDIADQIVALQKKQNEMATLESADPARVIAESKNFADNIRSGTPMEFKDITTADVPTATVSAMGRTHNRGLIPPTVQKLFLRSILPSASANFSAWQFVKETGYANNAAVVQEGAMKPQSDLTFSIEQGVVKKIAHWFRVSEEVLDDVSGMEGYIRERGIYGLMLKEEEQLLTGTGGAGALDGLLGDATAYNSALLPNVTPANAMDDVRVAIAQISEADLMGDTLVMNHLDAAALQLAKDADGRYLHPAFTGRSAWGLPMVTTKGIPQGEFFAGGLRGNVMLWFRKGLEVRKSTEDRDNFVHNMVTILIEERLGLEVTRPEALIYGELSTPAAPVE